MKHVLARLAMMLDWRRQDTGQVGQMWWWLWMCLVCVWGQPRGRLQSFLEGSSSWLLSTLGWVGFRPRRTRAGQAA